MRRHLVPRAERERRRAMGMAVLAPVCLVVMGVASSGMLPEGMRSRRLQSTRDREEYLIPPAVFSDEDKRSGLIVLHAVLMLYMFTALAIVCDEYFVDSLEVLTEALRVSPDVAGATFMELGGSAPELMTSLIGLFIFESDVGVGTIVGSASFNILFVISLCCFFATKRWNGKLDLAPYPVLRDSIFYAVCLAAMTAFLFDSRIELYEAIVQLALYVMYIVIMAYDKAIRAFFGVEDEEAEEREIREQSSAGSFGNRAMDGEAHPNANRPRTECTPPCPPRRRPPQRAS